MKKVLEEISYYAFMLLVAFLLIAASSCAPTQKRYTSNSPKVCTSKGTCVTLPTSREFYTRIAK